LAPANLISPLPTGAKRGMTSSADGELDDPAQIENPKHNHHDADKRQDVLPGAWFANFIGFNCHVLMFPVKNL
jgi:hypothetical protein